MDVVDWKFLLVGVVIVSMTLGFIEGKYFVTMDDGKKCSHVEGFYVECFDSKGGDWLSVYPINYLSSNNTFDAFDNAQMCMGYSVKHNYTICVREVK